MTFTREQLLPKLQNYRLEIRIIKEEMKYCVVNNYTDVVEFYGTMLPEIIPVLFHLEAGLDAAMVEVTEGTLMEKMETYLSRADSLEEVGLEDMFDDFQKETKTRLN
jgi:hypothetical protein